MRDDGKEYCSGCAQKNGTGHAPGCPQSWGFAPEDKGLSEPVRAFSETTSLREVVRKHFAPGECPLTDYEKEVLVVLIEEAGEVIQRATKLIRFGRETQPYDNIKLLGEEIGDFTMMVQFAKWAKLAKTEDITTGTLRKADRFKQYLQSEPPHA